MHFYISNAGNLGGSIMYISEALELSLEFGLVGFVMSLVRFALI